MNTPFNGNLKETSRAQVVPNSLTISNPRSHSWQIQEVMTHPKASLKSRKYQNLKVAYEVFAKAAARPQRCGTDGASEKVRGAERRPTRHNLAFLIFYFTPLLLGGAKKWLADVPRHPLSLSQNCLVWLHLSVSARSPSIGKTDQKGTDGCCVLPRAEQQKDRQPASRPVGQDPQTLLSLSAVRKWGKHIRGHCAACHIPVTPTPSENIIDLEIKQAVRLQIGFCKCLILPVRFFRRPDAFLHPPPPTTKSRLMLRTRPS